MSASSTTRFNFSPGPAILPQSVMRDLREDLLDFDGTGCSVMEVSHRGPEFMALAAELEARFRRVLGVPNDFELILMQGGASAQFALVPMNLKNRGPGGYVVTGHWGQKALAEANRLSSAVEISNKGAGGFIDVPREIDCPKTTAWAHITSNETIHGVQFPDDPDCNRLLVADMSSDLFSRPIDFKRYGLIYAGAQKNVGPAGLTFVMIRRDWLSEGNAELPRIFNYQELSRFDSMYNTPVSLSWYVANEVLKWLESSGGIAAIQKRNRIRSGRLYELIDSSDSYCCKVLPQARSVMNVVFNLATEEEEARFVASAENQGFRGLKGHRAVGGIRASLYNALPDSAIDALMSFMRDFEAGK